MNRSKFYKIFIVLGLTFLVFYWVYSFYENKTSELEKDIVVKTEKLQKLANIYNEIKINPAKNTVDESLMVFLQDTTAKTGVSEKVVFLKPKPSESAKEIVSLRLERLKLNHLISFLSEIDRYSNITISQMSVNKRFDEPEFADLNIDISKL